jgi:hypothetical protein
MSKRHEASRRRTYGRRQHEIHERTERPVRFLGWVEVDPSDQTESPIVPDHARANPGDWMLARSID